MSTRLIIYPYKLGSNSARELKDVFTSHRALRVRADGRYRPFRNHVILNWGSSTVPNWWGGIQNVAAQVINKPAAVEVASNKLLAFQKMLEGDVVIPEFTTSSSTAIEWVNSGCIVVARKLLRASEGRGIVIIEKERDAADITIIENAPLYVKYIKKQDEYRVHVFDGEVIDVQQKKKRMDIPNEDINYKVRNMAGGFIFAREDIEPPEQVLAEAKKAVAALGLTFGAVDMLMNNHYNKAYVIEVNTSPGLTGSTIESYKNAILRFMES